jgi:hypothetical protein
MLFSYCFRPLTNNCAKKSKRIELSFPELYNDIIWVFTLIQRDGMNVVKFWFPNHNSSHVFVILLLAKFRFDFFAQLLVKGLKQ